MLPCAWDPSDLSQPGQLPKKGTLLCSHPWDGEKNKNGVGVFPEPHHLESTVVSPACPASRVRNRTPIPGPIPPDSQKETASPREGPGVSLTPNKL